MRYKDFKELGNYVTENGNPTAIAYFFGTAQPTIDNRIDNYKYKHSDLSKEEHTKLTKILKINEYDILIGGEVHRIAGNIETKSLELVKVDEIELFYVLTLINSIKEGKI